MAMILAKQVTGNIKTISFWNFIHWAGYATASLGGEEHFKGGMEPMMPRWIPNNRGNGFWFLPEIIT